ncbi:serine hydrolase domain-containing protein [Streptomyces candidus]|uniref:CubicO group peptidase (Beta-lactamase class C family) n=1 Tax=Streptomyces candidus TaxID=67283 RepID=A0A7X0HAC5_9ACTN|nr:serine hydrolase domain-containing protein [Streptomyces candidus]MBB6434016.1 CubicO group peptidase (beta-lactamase class C family) [Streptomyces candidus]
MVSTVRAPDGSYTGELIRIVSTRTEVKGTVAAGYEEVREEFAAVLAHPDEGPDHAAQLVAYVRGERVVDLWGGPHIEADSLTPVYSSTKGAAHLVVALLVQDGVLDLDREVAQYWPEFGVHGKDRLTLRELLAHRSGVVGADSGFSPEELADDRAIAARLAGQRPYWRAGTAVGYHAYVIGALTGEVVRRVTGRTIQEWYEERVRAPYGLDFWMGAPEDVLPRVLDTLPMTPTPAQQAEMDASPTGAHSLGGIAFNLNAKVPTDLVATANSAAVRLAGPSSFGGVGSARGLAGMYQAILGGGPDGTSPLLDADVLAEFGQVHSDGIDLVGGARSVFGLGFQAMSAEKYPVLGHGAIGHSGAAGSVAFADPRNRIAYGYNRRRFAYPGGAAPENVRLVRALVRAASA